MHGRCACAGPPTKPSPPNLAHAPASLQGTQSVVDNASGICPCTTPTGGSCAAGQACCNGNCADGPGATLSGRVTTQLCGTNTCCPVCRPMEGLPAWHGGSSDRLACAMVTLAKRLGLQQWTQWAYIMGTIQHETGSTYKPIRECYSQFGASYCNGYTARYSGYYGRGYVQLTWQSNYKNFAVRAASCHQCWRRGQAAAAAADATATMRQPPLHAAPRPHPTQGIMACPLDSTPDLAMLPDVSLFVTVYGMRFGSFTGRKLDSYVSGTPSASSATRRAQYVAARAVVNGSDKADTIAGYALAWEAKVKACY